MALIPFRPELVGTHPLLLELLGGGTESIVAGAAFARIGKASLAMVLLAAIPGMMKFDPLYWWAGRLWGPRMIALVSGRSKRGLKLANRVPRWGRAFTWPAVVLAPFVPFPGMVIYVIAGWAGMRLVTFLMLNLIGTLMWAGALAGLGYAMGQRAVDIAQAVSHYGLWISLALVALIIAGQVRSARRARRSTWQHG